MDKGTINIFEVKVVRKDIGFKISAADVLNEFLYLGDEKGNIHSYPIRIGESDVISKNDNDNSRPICRNKIDKILCYKEISTILILAGETLYSVDSGFRRAAEPLATKIADFAINEAFDKDSGVYSVVAIAKKKEGMVFVYDATQKKLVDVKNRFSVSEVPNCVGYTGKFIVLAMKKEYESLNMDKDFALRRGPLQAKFPFVKVVAPAEILCFSDDIGLLMSPEFEPKPKDSINITRPIQQISLAGNYCFVLCDTVLQIYSNCKAELNLDDKRFSLAQEIPINLARGITNNKPFVYNKDDLYFLYEIPYETQIKGLLDRCRVDDAISLLIQKVGPDNEQKIEELKIEAIWPLLKKMLFDKVKDLAKTPSFDIRELIHLFPEFLSNEIDSMRNMKSEKSMATLIIEYVNEKSQRTKDDEEDLKKKSKLFLKDILEIKREFYLNQGVSGKIKRSFYKAKSSLIKADHPPQVTTEELLEIIDFTLIKYFMNTLSLANLESFLLSNPQIYCQKYFPEFEESFRKTAKLMDFPTLKPRLFTAFNKNDEALENWQRVAESSQKENVVKIACEEAVNLLAKLDDKSDIEDKLDWILKLRPEIAMKFFTMIPLNLLQSDKVIKKFEKDKNDKLLELFLETIVIDRSTEIEQYHTKLMLSYLEGLFKLNPKTNKEEGKSQEFLEKLTKFRKLLRNPTSKYASEPILKKIDDCEWLLEDLIELYSREKRHEEALKIYIKKSMPEAAVKYCEKNGEQTLTIYFKMLMVMYRSYEEHGNNTALLLKKDIVNFLSEHASSSELDPLTVLEEIPDDWLLSESEGGVGVHQFLESAITHTLFQKRSTYTSKHLSEMDLLNAEFNLVEAKKAFVKFTIKKKCCICNTHIADKFFVVYPNANVCHQACAKKEKNTVCPITKQDFEKTYKY